MEEYFDPENADLFSEPEPIPNPQFTIKREEDGSKDGIIHIMKQLKANNTDKYIHFGRSLFEIIPDETQGIVYPVHTKKVLVSKNVKK